MNELGLAVLAASILVLWIAVSTGFAAHARGLPVFRFVTARFLDAWESAWRDDRAARGSLRRRDRATSWQARILSAVAAFAGITALISLPWSMDAGGRPIGALPGIDSVWCFLGALVGARYLHIAASARSGHAEAELRAELATRRTVLAAVPVALALTAVGVTVADGSLARLAHSQSAEPFVLGWGVVRHPLAAVVCAIALWPAPPIDTDRDARRRELPFAGATLIRLGISRRACELASAAAVAVVFLGASDLGVIGLPSGASGTILAPLVIGAKAALVHVSAPRISIALERFPYIGTWTRSTRALAAIALVAWGSSVVVSACAPIPADRESRADDRTDVDHDV
jgi:hypothetical protein